MLKTGKECSVSHIYRPIDGVNSVFFILKLKLPYIQGNIFLWHFVMARKCQNPQNLQKIKLAAQAILPDVEY